MMWLLLVLFVVLPVLAFHLGVAAEKIRRAPWDEEWRES